MVHVFSRGLCLAAAKPRYKVGQPVQQKLFGMSSGYGSSVHGASPPYRAPLAQSQAAYEHSRMPLKGYGRAVSTALMDKLIVQGMAKTQYLCALGKKQLTCLGLSAPSLSLHSVFGKKAKPSFPSLFGFLVIFSPDSPLLGFCLVGKPMNRHSRS